MAVPLIVIAPDLRAIVALGVVAFERLGLARPVPALDEAMTAAEGDLRLDPPGPGAAVRRMYSRVGLDPTRRRPSSEALLRRVVRGEPLPRINPLVDLCNWCSVELQLPYGLYDRGRLEGPIDLRVGAEGEQYAGIGKDVVHVGGRLVLADRIGPFGNPSSDSARTMVTRATAAAVAVIFVPVEAGREAVARAIDLTARRAREFLGADRVDSAAIGP